MIEAISEGWMRATSWLWRRWWGKPLAVPMFAVAAAVMLLLLAVMLVALLFLLAMGIALVGGLIYGIVAGVADARPVPAILFSVAAGFALIGASLSALLLVERFWSNPRLEDARFATLGIAAVVGVIWAGSLLVGAGSSTDVSVPDRPSAPVSEAAPEHCGLDDSGECVDPDDLNDDCDPNYSGECLSPDALDYDCEGGSGDGPDYTGPVEVVGEDPHGLDADGDGYACE